MSEQFVFRQNVIGSALIMATVLYNSAKLNFQVPPLTSENDLSSIFKIETTFNYIFSF